MAFKQYVLLDHLDTNAPIYQRLNKDQRIKLKKIPVYSPYLQVTFTSEEKNEKGELVSKSRTIRYKERSNSVYQDVQIKDEGIPANDRYTTNERNAVIFNNGVLTTNKPMVQKFLDVSPQNEKFVGICTEVVRPDFKEYIPGEVIKTKNADFMKRLEVGNKIAKLGLIEAQDMLIRINGSFFEVPDNLEEAQNQLIAFMDETDEEGLEQMLKNDKDLTADEKATVLIGNAINAGLISFNAVEGQVTKSKGNKTIKLKEIPTDLTQAEKERYFADFLTTEAGIPLATDLGKELEATKSKTK